jgi:lipid II:glycine glycyltransferase (peptidoglycan interpeptide bridge formation enzyme)
MKTFMKKTFSILAAIAVAGGCVAASSVQSPDAKTRRSARTVRVGQTITVRVRKGKKQKIEDFYWVMADAIDKVMDSADKEKAFKNFITIFEAIVAYHKAEEKQ